MPDVTVVIPTFGEFDNLARLLPLLLAILRQAGFDAEVIVVDDDSRDGTDALCERLAMDHTLRLITRRDERGLATAVLCGLREARGDVCVVMDADFSHPPEAVPALVAAARSPDCDMVIGSRYITGGSVDQHWSWFRRLNSRVFVAAGAGIDQSGRSNVGFLRHPQRHALTGGDVASTRI